MKNSYIKIIMSNKNELRTDVSISVGSLGLSEIKDINIKIDTGCSHTSIPIQKLGVSKAQAMVMKQQDIMNNSIKKEISFGVNDTKADRRLAKTMFKSNNYMQLKQVTFKHKDLKIDFGGIVINKPEVKISYDRSGNILIGMDILKDWDIHIGTISSGETIFLGCPKSQINDEYLQELENTFHIASDINALTVRQKLT